MFILRREWKVPGRLRWDGRQRLGAGELRSLPRDRPVQQVQRKRAGVTVRERRSRISPRSALEHWEPT